MIYFDKTISIFNIIKTFSFVKWGIELVGRMG
jgi:hypothetical protein